MFKSIKHFIDFVNDNQLTVNISDSTGLINFAKEHETFHEMAVISCFDGWNFKISKEMVKNAEVHGCNIHIGKIMLTLPRHWDEASEEIKRHTPEKVKDDDKELRYFKRAMQTVFLNLTDGETGDGFVNIDEAYELFRLMDGNSNDYAPLNPRMLYEDAVNSYLWDVVANIAEAFIDLGES